MGNGVFDSCIVNTPQYTTCLMGFDKKHMSFDVILV
jgi:hypothetical protein